MALAKCTHRKANGAFCTGVVDTEDDTWYITTSYYSSAFMQRRNVPTMHFQCPRDPDHTITYTPDNRSNNDV